MQIKLENKDLTPEIKKQKDEISLFLEIYKLYAELKAINLELITWGYIVFQDCKDQIKLLNGNSGLFQSKIA